MLENKVAVITGAAAGIGNAIARVYAGYGAKLCLLDMDESIEEEAKKIAEEYHTQALGFKVNVADKDYVNSAVKKTYEEFGKIDIACLNAGVSRVKNFDQMDDEMRDLHIDVNRKGVWNCAKAVIPYMKEAKQGSIVIASSVTGDIVADPGESAYAMTKSALVGLTKALAVEYAPYNIRVNCSQLGYARTPMVEKMAVDSNPDNPEEVIDAIAANVPLGRLAKPEEVGELFAFLGSDKSSYITGSQIVIDGGATLPETTSMGN